MISSLSKTSAIADFSWISILKATIILSLHMLNCFLFLFVFRLVWKEVLHVYLMCRWWSPLHNKRETWKVFFFVSVPRTVLRDQYDQGDSDSDEEKLEPEEGFDRADFRGEFSPSPNLEGPQSQPRDNASGNFPTVSSSPPYARTNDGEYRTVVRGKLHVVMTNSTYYKAYIILLTNCW